MCSQPFPACPKASEQTIDILLTDASPCPALPFFFYLRIKNQEAGRAPKLMKT